ncbi:hypothetical protein [Lentzea sp. NPDC003310]|uniref:hypothetical protein n=1 Tax=Lentzea sp. NPDC003310 TaxID=3154447 RepID=UPI0033AF4811
MSVDQWLNEQLASLHSALDEVLDLDRGLVDASLPCSHSDLLNRIGDEMDLDAGLARAVAPRRSPTAEPGLEPYRSLAAVDDELSVLPPAARLAARAGLPDRSLLQARTLAAHLPRVRALAEKLKASSTLNHNAQAAATAVAQDLVNTLDQSDAKHVNIFHEALKLTKSLEHPSEVSTRWAAQHASALDRLCESGLRVLLSAFHHRGRKIKLGHPGLRLTMEELTDLVASIGKIRTTLNSMVGADLTTADLTGVPLDGVRWSPRTRWPRGWLEWVRANSVPVSAGIFEIRPGSTSNRVPT